MNFRTSVDLPLRLPPVSHAGHLLMLGSCFAENIGRKLSDYKFSIDLNPFGILYNPLSVAKALHEIVEGKIYNVDDLFFYRDCWHSSMHHGQFSSPDKEVVLAQINDRLLSSHRRMDRTDWLLITFGTSYVYQQKESGQVVSNCHQLPERSFTRRRLSVAEIVATYQTILSELFTRYPQLKILCTVSPIRHIRDGMTENQLSKATLMLAIDELRSLYPEQLFYFPSYEIVLDELRDYRFYADDMVHPSSLAVEYIWEKFSETFFSDATIRLMKTVEEINRALTHKPFRPESDGYKDFIKQTLFKIDKLNGEYPYLDFQKEIELCRMRLNQ